MAFGLNTILGGIKNIAATIASPVTGLIKGANQITGLGANIGSFFTPPSAQTAPVSNYNPNPFSVNINGQTFTSLPLSTGPATIRQPGETGPGVSNQANIKLPPKDWTGSSGTMPKSTPAPTAPARQQVFDPGTGKMEFTTGESGTGGTSAQQFGGGTGVSGIEGGGASLPGSLGGTFRSAGGINLQSFNEDEEKKKNVVAVTFAGSPDLFDSITGLRLTPEKAAELGAFTNTPGVLSDKVLRMETTRPGVTSESQFAQLGSQPLSATEIAQLGNVDVEKAADVIDAAKNGETTNTAKDIYNQLLKLQEAGVATQKELQDKLKSANEEKTKVQEDLNALGILTLAEVKEISDDPDFSKTLKARRTAFLESFQSPFFLARMELNTKLANAEARKANVLEEIGLTTTQDKNAWDRSKQLYDLMKVDNISYKTDAKGVMHAVSYDPINNKFNDISLGGGYEKSKTYSDLKIEEVNGQKVAFAFDENGAVAKQTVLGAITQKASDVTTGVSIENWSKLIISGQASLTNVPVSQRSAVVNEIAKSPDVLLSDKDREKLNVLDTAENVVKTLKDLSNGIAPANALTRLYGGPLDYLQAKTQTGTKESVYLDARTGFVSNVARTLGEKGALAEGDVTRAINNIPALSDTKAVSDEKFKVLDGIFTKARESIIKTSTTPSSNLSGQATTNVNDPLGLY